MPFSVLWDYSTAPVRGQFSFINFVREIEKRLYPDQIVERKDALLYVDDPVPSEIDGNFEDKLNKAGFKLMRSGIRGNSEEADEKIGENALKYLRMNENIELVLISGDRDYGPRIFHFINLYASKFHLISARGTCNRFKPWATSVLSLDEIISYTRDPNCSVKPSPPIVGFAEACSVSEPEMPSRSSRARVSGRNKPLDTGRGPVQKPNLATKLTRSRSRERSASSHRSGERFLCMFTFDYEKRKGLVRFLEKTIADFGGHVVSCWDGVGTIEFNTEDRLKQGKDFLNSLSIYDVKVNSTSVAPAVKKPPKNLQRKVRHLSVTDSNNDGYETKSDYSDDDGHALSGTEKKIFPATFFKTDKTDDEESVEPSAASLKQGFFLILFGLRKSQRIKWYRDEIKKLLKGINLKMIYFDPKADWAVLGFHSLSDQRAAQVSLHGEQLPGENTKLEPEAVTTLPESYVERIRNFQSFMASKEVKKVREFLKTEPVQPSKSTDPRGKLIESDNECYVESDPPTIITKEDPFIPGGTYGGSHSYVINRTIPSRAPSTSNASLGEQSKPATNSQPRKKNDNCVIV